MSKATKNAWERISTTAPVADINFRADDVVMRDGSEDNFNAVLTKHIMWVLLPSRKDRLVDDAHVTSN